jgi:hypothetical protein
LTGKTWTDELGGTLGNIDELFGWTVTEYTAATFGADLEKYLRNAANWKEENG